MLSVTALADSEGFEPPEVLPSLAFETSALGRSANYPLLTFANICQRSVYRVFLNKINGR